MKKSALLLILLLFSGVAITEEDKTEFKLGLLVEYKSSLCVADFTDCLSIERNECLSSVETLVANCPSDPFYTAVVKRNIKDMQTSGRAFGMCVIKGLVAKSGAPEEKALKCVKLLATEAGT